MRMTRNDVVLATKDRVGDPRERWAVGLYGGWRIYGDLIYHYVQGHGEYSYLKCSPISPDIAEYLSHFEIKLSNSAVSLWTVVRQLRKSELLLRRLQTKCDQEEDNGKTNE